MGTIVHVTVASTSTWIVKTFSTMAPENLYLRLVIVFTIHQPQICKVEHLVVSEISSLVELKMKIAQSLKMARWIMTQINPDLAGYI